MKNLLLTCVLLSSSISALCQNLDQEVIACSGKSSVNQNFQITWTLGEAITNTINSENCILSQGFHQSNLIVSSIGMNDFPGLSVSIFPNPTREIVTIQLKSADENSRIIELIDMSGRVCLFEKSSHQEIKINLLNYKKGLYFLRIHDSNGKHLGSFKIVKYGF